MIRDVPGARLAEAAQLAAAAFREDPGFSYILPDDADRRLRLPALIEALLRVDLRAGGRVRGAYEGGALIGVAACLPAEAPNPSLADWLREARALAWLGARPAALLRALGLLAALERLRPAGDDYLHLLAVHPATQGRGAGTELARDAGAPGRALYLETFTAENAAWYEARGFRLAAAAAASARPPFWTLRRPAA